MLFRSSTQELVTKLNDANGWVRSTAFRLLAERADKAAGPLLKSVATDSSTQSPTARSAALNLLNGAGLIDEAGLLESFDDPAPRVRESAVLLAEQRLAARSSTPVSPLAKRVAALADDSDARVRFVSVLALGGTIVANPDGAFFAPVSVALDKAALRDATNRWSRAAVFSSVPNKASDLFNASGVFIEPIGKEQF